MEALVVNWWLWLEIGFGLGSDFVIVRDSRRITIKGRISVKRATTLRSFIQNDLADDLRFAVAGTKLRNGGYRFRWAGRLDQRNRQCIRNVLIDVLG